MNSKLNIEELLKRFRRDPAPRVKRAVLARYTERCGGTRGASPAAPFWRRSVPLYAAVTLIIVTAGLAFVAGQTLPREEGSVENSSLAARDTLPDSPPEQQWYYAPSDIF